MPRVTRLKTFSERWPQGPASNGAGMYIPTYYLSLVIQRTLDRLPRPVLFADPTPEENTGVWQLAAQISSHTGHAIDSSNRRLFSILRGEMDCSDYDTTDNILLALDLRLGEEDLPIFPVSAIAAAEMIDAYFERTTGTTPLNREELIHTLHRFACGFARGEEAADHQVFRTRQKQRGDVKRRVRKCKRAAVAA